jgi:tetratricopeptide (TPR) repeat protein
MLAWAFHLRGDQYEGSPRAREAIDRAVALGEELGDDPIRGRPLLAKGIARLLSGRFEEAVALNGDAAGILTRSGELLWAFEAQSYYLWALMRLGRFDEAEVAATTMLDLAARSGSPTAAVDCQAALAMLREEREQFDEALALAHGAAEQGEAHRVFTCAAFGHMVEGGVRYRRGEYEAAIRSLLRSSRLARLTHAFFIENLGRAALSAAKWKSGERAAALAGWTAVLDSARATGDRYAEGEVLAFRGTAFAGEPETRAQGIADLEQSVGLLGELGARPAMSRAMLALADGLDAVGQRADAAAVAARAHALRQELGLPVQVATAAGPGQIGGTA